MSVGTIQRATKRESIKRWLSLKAMRWQRWAAWKFRGFDLHDRRVILLMGCQRSGTSLLADVFEKDNRVTVFQEESRITGKGEHRIRLLDLPTVRATFAACPTPLIVAKPLVESQRALELLNEIPDSRVVWIFRNFADVVHSNLHRFVRQQIRNLVPMVERDSDNWRSQNMSNETYEVIRTFYSPEMERADAAALMWYARNRLFIEQQLGMHPRVTLCRYEDLVQQPGPTMRRLYDNLGASYPGDHLVSDIDARSVGNGNVVSIRRDIKSLCEDVQKRLLDECYRSSE